MATANNANNKVSTFIDENSTIYGLTNGKYRSLKYNASNPSDNYKGPLVEAVLKLIKKAGGDVTNTHVKTVGQTFTDIIKAYQKANSLPQTGILTDSLLHNIYNKAVSNSSDIIEDNFNNTKDSQNQLTDSEGNITVLPHYDPFFLNNSSKDARKNHKDIIISFGDGSHSKIIKDVFMRSVSVEVDTQGNPISEIYQFIARDLKETDANEDKNKYTVESLHQSASSDIRYDYAGLFDNP